MRKFRLELDTLSVESFNPVNESRDARGTVDAHGITGGPRCIPPTGMTFCETNCDCTLGCPSIAPCTEQLY